jgi:hypothetical protein
MESDNLPTEETETEVKSGGQKSNLHKVTPISKYLAMALFILLPFIGGWIGYSYAPEKVVEVERVVEVEKVLRVNHMRTIPSTVVKLTSIEDVSANKRSGPSVTLDIDEDKKVFLPNPMSSCGGDSLFALHFSSVDVDSLSIKLTEKGTSTTFVYEDSLDLSAYENSATVDHVLSMSPELIFGTSEYLTLLKAAGELKEYSVVFYDRDTDKILLEENVGFMIIPFIVDC